MTGFAGTWDLVRLGLRRDRIMLPSCVVLLVVLAAGSAKATEDLYAGQSALDAIQATLASPAIVALYGPLANIDNPDSLSIFKTYLLGGIGLALLAFAIVRRHTRTEEEAGRTELLGAGVVGRNAQLAAAVLLAVGASVATGALSAVGLIGAGLGSQGSWAFGVGWIGMGLSFTAVTAVAAQLTTTARGCAAWALGAMGVAYVLRAIGDTSSGASWVSWLSPFGWAEKIGPFGADRFVVALLSLAFTLVLLGLAGLLLARRDIGAGLLASRPGPTRARPSLRSAGALAWRLQRGALLGWAIGIALLGLALGVVATSVSGLAQSAGIEDMLRALGGDAGTLSDAFIATEVQFVAIAAAAYGISAALRLRSEETDLHIEQLLATPASRRSVLAGHSVIALLGSALLMVLFGLTSAIGYGRGTDGVGTAFAHLLPTALATIPAIWVCVGLALAVFGSLPRIVYVAWGLLAIFVVIGEFGTLLNLPDALIGISPFQHGQVLPGGTLDAWPLLALTAIAALLVLAAGITFQRRDVA